MDVRTAPTAAEAAALNLIGQNARQLRNALQRVTADAEQARERIDSGQRPAYSVGGVFGQGVTDAQTAVAQINAALAILDDPLFDTECGGRVRAAFTGARFIAPREAS